MEEVILEEKTIAATELWSSSINYLSMTVGGADVSVLFERKTAGI